MAVDIFEQYGYDNTVEDLTGCDLQANAGLFLGFDVFVLVERDQDDDELDDVVDGGDDEGD